jgi:hypothetical protein
MVYGIAISDFDTVIGMIELRKDIEMFNPKLRLATLSRWVIFRKNRIGKMHGSVVLSFDNDYYYYYYYSSISACSPRAGTNNIHICAPL